MSKCNHVSWCVNAQSQPRAPVKPAIEPSTHSDDEVDEMTYSVLLNLDPKSPICVS
jgi:hypothetical protein